MSYIALIGVLLLCIMGCTTGSCRTCVDAQAHIKDAEQWMSNHSTKLAYPGDWDQAFEIEYNAQHRWIVVRDTMFQDTK